MKITVYIAVVLLCLLLCACAPKRVSIEHSRAVYYQQEFERIYAEYEALQDQVYQKATPGQREKRAALKSRFLALWETMSMDLRADDDNLTMILTFIARLPL